MMKKINWQKALLQIAIFMISVPIVAYLGGYYYDLCFWIVKHSMPESVAEVSATLMGFLWAIGTFIYAVGGALILIPIMFEKEPFIKELSWLSCRIEPK